MVAVLTEIGAILAPHRCALLVIDVQNDFVHPRGWAARHAPEAPSLRGVIGAINPLIAAARAAGVTVAYICMTHAPELDAANYRARYQDRGMSGDLLCRDGTWGAALDETLAPPGPGDLTVIRHGYDGFTGTDLDALLRARGVETLVATGVVTDLCVQTTVQHGFALGYYVVVASDGTAAATPQRHQMALDNFARFFGPVMPGEAIAAHWQTKDPLP